MDAFEKVMHDAGVWSSCISESTYKNVENIIELIKDAIEIKCRGATATGQ